MSVGMEWGRSCLSEERVAPWAAARLGFRRGAILSWAGSSPGPQAAPLSRWVLVPHERTDSQRGHIPLSTWQWDLLESSFSKWPLMIQGEGYGPKGGSGKVWPGMGVLGVCMWEQPRVTLWLVG